MGCFFIHEANVNLSPQEPQSSFQVHWCDTRVLVGLEQKGKSPGYVLWPFWGQRTWRAPRLGGVVSSHRLQESSCKEDLWMKSLHPKGIVQNVGRASGTHTGIHGR